MTRIPRRQGSGEIHLLRISTGEVVTVWFPRSDIHPASGAGSSSITQLTCWAVLREKKLVRLNQTQCTFIHVVYTDQHRYITIRRKTELALGLSLSERQVEIWFQNTKERKITKKIQLYQQASKTSTTLTLTLSSLADPGNDSMATSFNSSSFDGLCLHNACFVTMLSKVLNPSPGIMAGSSGERT
uniref:Homeobox domain-containing protein n=1 Tax=Oncorhynchus mykiss TaxID=8022 RepID=A0A8C7RQP5_ONCMY